MTIHRVTLFNIPKPEDIDVLLAEYRTLAQEAKRVCTYQQTWPSFRDDKLILWWLQDSEPYIVSVQAGRTLPDGRTKGYTLAVKTTFHNLDDMYFYDNNCQAHKRLKSVASPKREGDVFTAYFEDEVGATT